MRNIQRNAFVLFSVVLMSMPVMANAASVSIQSLTPSATVLAKTGVSFQIVPSGFSSPVYQLTDSFGSSTLAPSNIDTGGKLSWTPVASDAGVHNLTLTATDNSGTSATANQTITVLPPPSVSAQSITASAIMPGTHYSFTAVATGFTNPTYIVGDSLSGSSVTDSNITSSGNFTWTPDISQNGQHTITVYVSDSLGHSASVAVPLRVGIGPTINVTQITPSTSITPGQLVMFSAAPLNYSPTGFSVVDSFHASTISNANINTSGAFSWAPQVSDVGTHLLTITGLVGAYGDSATTSVTLTVLGPGGVPVATTTPTTTSGTSTSTLSSLQAQLALLQSQMAQSSATTAPSSTTFTAYLHPGSNGAEVTQLQKTLAQLGFFSGTPNGNYGPATIAAVIKFQTAHHLSKLGVVGPATRTALNALDTSSSASTAATSSSGDGYVFEHFMGVGDTDPDVTELQKRLVSLGFMTGAASGYYGPTTESAVKKFQAKHALTATGYVDTVTRTALNQ